MQRSPCKIILHIYIRTSIQMLADGLSVSKFCSVMNRHIWSRLTTPHNQQGCDDCDQL